MTESLVAEAVDQQFLETHHPVTGEVLGRRPIDDEAAVADAVACACAAASRWAGIGAKARKAALRRWAKHLIANIDDATHPSRHHVALPHR